MTSPDTFTTSHVFKAPRQKVWDAWTKPELLARWFGPKGVTTTVVSAEFRPGGIFHGYMDQPGGGRLWVRFLYRELSPPSRMVYEHSFSDERGNIAGSPFSDHWPKILLTTVTFEDAGEDTRMRLTQVPLDATAAEAAEFRDAMESMIGGWGGSFAVLEEVLPDIG